MRRVITYWFPCLHSSWKWQPLCTGSYEDMGQVFEYNRHRCQRNHNNQVPHCQISPQWLHFFHQNMIGRNLAALSQEWESKWFSWVYAIQLQCCQLCQQNAILILLLKNFTRCHKIVQTGPNLICIVRVWVTLTKNFKSISVGNTVRTLNLRRCCHKLSFS